MGILSPQADERVKNIIFKQQLMDVQLKDGRIISVPLAWYPRLLHATAQQRLNFTIGPDGYEIHWPDVDEDLHVEGILRGSWQRRVPCLSQSERNTETDVVVEGRRVKPKDIYRDNEVDSFPAR